MLFLEAKNSRILDVMSFSANQRAGSQGYTGIGDPYEIREAGGRSLAFTGDNEKLATVVRDIVHIFTLTLDRNNHRPAPSLHVMMCNAICK